MASSNPKHPIGQAPPSPPPNPSPLPFPPSPRDTPLPPTGAPPKSATANVTDDQISLEIGHSKHQAKPTAIRWVKVAGEWVQEYPVAAYSTKWSPKGVFGDRYGIVERRTATSSSQSAKRPTVRAARTSKRSKGKAKATGKRRSSIRSAPKVPAPRSGYLDLTFPETVLADPESTTLVLGRVLRYVRRLQAEPGPSRISNRLVCINTLVAGLGERSESCRGTSEVPDTDEEGSSENEGTM